MNQLNIIFILILALIGLGYAGRLTRSPQFGGAQASAQAQAFGGNRFNRFPPPPPPPRPSFGLGNRGFGNNGFGQRAPQGSISISKSVSISAGRGGAQSSSSANSFGKR